MAATKKRPTIGDRVWRVEWVSEMAFDECGDVDHDHCTESYRTFPTREEARAFAEKTYPETLGKFGIVEVDELEYQSHGDEEYPWLADWQIVSDHSEIFSGEWEE